MEHTLIGEIKIVDNEKRYYPGGTMQGYVFKDEKAFETGEGICYLSEYDFYDDCDNSVEYLTEEQAIKVGETRASIEKQCEEILGDKKYAEDIFEIVDWQSVNALAWEYSESIEEESEEV